MGCTHPFGLDAIRDESGKIIGGRCPSCKCEAYVDEGLWSTLKRNRPCKPKR